MGWWSWCSTCYTAVISIKMCSWSPKHLPMALVTFRLFCLVYVKQTQISASWWVVLLFWVGSMTLPGVAALVGQEDLQQQLMLCSRAWACKMAQPHRQEGCGLSFVFAGCCVTSRFAGAIQQPLPLQWHVCVLHLVFPRGKQKCMVRAGLIAHLPAGFLLRSSSQTSGKSFSWLHHSLVLHSSPLLWAVWHLQSVFFPCLLEKKIKEQRRIKVNISMVSKTCGQTISQHCKPHLCRRVPQWKASSFPYWWGIPSFLFQVPFLPFLKKHLNKVLANPCFWALDLGLEGKVLVKQ